MRNYGLKFALIATLPLASHWASADHRKQSNESAGESPSEVASTWFEQLYDIVKEERTPPPQASRTYGIAAVALYESVAAGTKHNRSLVGQLNGLRWMPKPEKNRKYHWPTVANAVLAKTIRGLFPAISQSSAEAINILEQEFASQQRAVIPKKEYEHSVAYGQAVATVILAWASSDGYSMYNNCPYIPVHVMGAWEATPPLFSSNPLQPCWGSIRPMVMTSGDECRPAGHPRFSRNAPSAFYSASLEVYRIGVGLTEAQKTIASYWSDNTGATGTPPGHWIAIVSQIASNHDLSLAEAAEAYARVGIAVHDAFIVCWKAKYAFNLQRPVTYINHNIDDSWLPYLVTPNFPSYPSGHSMQSGAAALVLADMFGTVRFTDTTHIDHGLLPPQEPRTFRSFAEAANEAAVSRLYGGIHYAFDNVDGLASGQCVGRAVRERVRFRGDRHRNHDKDGGNNEDD